MRGSDTLDDLHWAIFEAFDREDPHCYQFELGGKKPMDRKAQCSASKIVPRERTFLMQRPPALTHCLCRQGRECSIGSTLAMTGGIP